MSLIKRFKTPYLEIERGGGRSGVLQAYILFEFKCSCGKAEINCPCIKEKKNISGKSIEESEILKLPIYGKTIIYEY
jgi:hypothetical protein